MFCLPLGRSHLILENYYQYYVGVLVILIRLAQLSELPEDPEPSSSLVLTYCVSSVYGYSHHSQLKEFLKLFLLYEFKLCLAGLQMASENTAMQSYFCGSLQCYFR